jgi:hypothetical protein
VKEPRDALEAARRAAAAAPDADVEPAPWSVEHTPVPMKQLVEWAIIEPDTSDVYSTRRFGQPITAFKRLLIRLLYQYLGEMSAQQSRFNAHILARVLHLEERVRVLEEAASAPSGSPAPGGSRARAADEST